MIVVVVNIPIVQNILSIHKLMLYFLQTAFYLACAYWDVRTFILTCDMLQTENTFTKE